MSVIFSEQQCKKKSQTSIGILHELSRMLRTFFSIFAAQSVQKNTLQSLFSINICSRFLKGFYTGITD